MDKDVNMDPKVSTLTKGYAAAAECWAKGTMAQCIDLLNLPFNYGIVGFAYLDYKNGDHDCTQQVHTIFRPVFTTPRKKERWYYPAKLVYVRPVPHDHQSHLRQRE